MKEMRQIFSGRRAWLAGKALFYLAIGTMMFQVMPTPIPARDARPPAAQAPERLVPETESQPVAAQPRPRQSLSDIVVTKELPIERWLKPGEFAWDDEGVPAGPTTIVVNIRGRVLSAYRAGQEIGRSSIVYGTDGKPTPTGTFPILEKKADHYSNLYDNAPMPHMMRLTWDGVALHGAEMADDIATHGCIGLPKEFASLLFKAAKVGDQVIVWKGDRLPSA